MMAGIQAAILNLKVTGMKVIEAEETWSSSEEDFVDKSHCIDCRPTNWNFPWGVGNKFLL